MKPSNGLICQTALPSPHRAFNILFVFVFCLSATIAGNEALHLTGVTVLPDHPRADILTSFYSELLAEVATISNFNLTYNLRMMPSSTPNGGAVGEMKPEGLIGEVYNNRADFVIADMEITTERDKLIEFTRPFLRSKLGALVRRLPPANQTSTNGAGDSGHSKGDNSGGQTSDKTATTLRALLQKSKRGVVRGSTAEQYFRTHDDSKVYHLLPSPEPSFQAAVQKVADTPDFVLISDTARLDLVAANDCQFTVVTPVEGDPTEIGLDFKLEYAVGFHDNSLAFQQFDTALEELELSGKLSALIEQHWADYCASKMADDAKSEEQQSEETNGAPSLTPWLAISATLAIIRLLTTWTNAGALY